MHRIGLALSGGGFRATLFHLGMVRFLREANILPEVTHITSVSGGSVLAAHLVLNWHRYTDSLKEFDAAAAELIRFVQLDVRNRVVRRYPLAMPLRALDRMTFRRRHRQLSRTGLLEYHYEKFLYGDTCLSQLPDRPRLHILATNLSEGCLCAFTRDGLVMQRRRPGHRFRFDRIHAGLATLPMAVTASSAFPGFFPHSNCRGQDVGADPGQFGQVAFTDGGVYDNLGVRMFKCLEQSWLAREIRLQRGDLADIEQVASALETAAQSSEDSPLRRLAQMMALSRRETAQPVNSSGEAVDQLLHELWDVMNREDLAREPVFARLSPPDPDVEPLLTAARQGGEIEAGEQLWLNRQLVEAAFRQATGKPCFRSLNVCFDTVLVSDAGKQFKISNARSGGLIARSMRATDIVMDRVWQLETDTFSGTPGFVFAPISKVVEADEDPTAIHPEMQRMAADIRTDLDRFWPLEISALSPARLLRRPQRVSLVPGTVRVDDARQRPVGSACREERTSETGRSGRTGRPRHGHGTRNRASPKVAAIWPATGLEHPVGLPRLDFIRLRAAAGPDSCCSPVLRHQMVPPVSGGAAPDRRDGPEQRRLCGDEQTAPRGSHSTV